MAIRTITSLRVELNASICSIVLAFSLSSLKLSVSQCCLINFRFIEGAKAMPGKALVFSLFATRYNSLKHIAIAMGKRLMTPLFHFRQAESKVNFPFIYGNVSIEKGPSRHLHLGKVVAQKYELVE
jgi:hypothetical protein